MGEHTPVGQFCWWSLMSTDVERANRFYRDLFGWTFSTMKFPDHSTSTIYHTGKGGFANPVPLEENFPGPSHWITYITVKDVAQACQHAETLGGTVCVPPFDIPTIGRTAVITDPAGAAFHVFEPFQEEGESNMIGNGPGEICWMELMVDDPSQVIPFYGDLFGWRFSEPMDVNGGVYRSFENGGEKLGGIFKRPADVPPMPPAWMVYFSVASVDAAAERVKALGGCIMVEKTAIPSTGFFACIADPTGAHSYLFELTAPALS
jgi:predicted enzyme related to lactoylglutathione lyase